MITAVSQLEELLQRIGYRLDLSPSQHQLVDERYLTIGKWLREDAGILGKFGIEIFPQGSMRIGTTTKPGRRQEENGKIIFNEQKEFDLDFVYLLSLRIENLSPLAVLDALEKRFRDHEVYRKMVERKNRCIRLNYSNEFHMDILPACKLTYPGTVIAIPDRERRAWLSSNPKGYAEWFEGRAGQGRKEFFESVQPLPDHTHMKAPLVRIVQLLKRWRDRSFTKEMAPCSILLTTLAGHLFSGEIGTFEALRTFLTRLDWEMRQAQGVLEVRNPSNPDELFSEQWRKSPASYREFCVQVRSLAEQIELLSKGPGLEKTHEILKNLFGEAPVREALIDSASATQKLREQGKLGMNRNTGVLGVAVAPSVVVKPNTFFGDGIL